MQVNVFILHRSPEPLDKNIVDRPAFTIHADLYLSSQQQAGKNITGKLRALIGIKYFRTSVHFKSFFDNPAAPFRCIVLLRPQFTTKRVCKSITAHRYINPRRIGTYVISIAQTWLGLSIRRPLSI